MLSEIVLYSLLILAIVIISLLAWIVVLLGAIGVALAEIGRDLANITADSNEQVELARKVAGSLGLRRLRISNN